MSLIEAIHAREILDSRGNPTVEAEVLLERIRACAESYPWSQLVNQELSVTCTLGATQYQKGETAEALISRADRAMYQGKALGRNRLVLA